jgi:hypothetical protein
MERCKLLGASVQQCVFKGSNLSDSALDDNFLEHPHKDFSGVRTGATSAACFLTRDAPQVNLSNCRFHNLQLSSWGMPNRARDFTKACLIGCVFRNSNLEASPRPPSTPSPHLAIYTYTRTGLCFQCSRPLLRRLVPLRPLPHSFLGRQADARKLEQGQGVRGSSFAHISACAGGCEVRGAGLEQLPRAHQSRHDAR